MNKFLRRINRKMTLSSASALIAGSLTIGFALGFIRTKLIYSNFNDFETGAYFAAFDIPDLIFYTFSAGALSVAFIPVFSDKVFKSNLAAAWRMASSVLNCLALVMLPFSLALVLFPEFILEHLVAPGFSPKRIEVTAQIMRLAAINPLVFSITSVFSSVQQVFGRFFYFAVAPLFYNLSIIASIYLFKDSMGIVGIGLGVAVGALLNILIFGLGMNKLDFRHNWLIDFKDKAFRQVIKALPPRSFDQGIIYINSIVQTRIASTISIEAISNLKGALYLYNAPISLLGMALGTAAFPRFSKYLSRNRPDLFKQEFLVILKAIIWLSIPVVIFSFATREYWARIIFSRENSEIALVFGWLCLGIFFRTMYAIISRFYYAQKDTLTPLFVTILVFISNIIFSWLLAERYGVSGLGMATSAVAVLEILVLVAIIHRRNAGLFNSRFIKDLAAIGATALGVAFCALAFASWLPLESGDRPPQFLGKLFAILILTFALHLVFSRLFKVGEAKRLWRYLYGVSTTRIKPLGKKKARKRKRHDR